MNNSLFILVHMGWDNSEPIATRCRLDCHEIEYRCRRYFQHWSNPAVGPTKFPIPWVPVSFLK